MARRAALDPAARQLAGRAALLKLMTALPLRPESVVAAFWPMAAEIDTRPLFEALAAFDVATCLPRMSGKRRPLSFCRFRPGDGLLEGPMRVLEPLPAARLEHPSIVVVPLLAFDDAGYRLGYGGGFYDRTLPTLAVGTFVIGLAFEAQRMPALPHEPTDVRLGRIVTEADVHHFP